MRLVIILLLVAIGTFIAFSVGTNRPHAQMPAPAGTAHTNSMIWATSTNPHEDPQVSQVPPLQAPPQPMR